MRQSLALALATLIALAVAAAAWAATVVGTAGPDVLAGTAAEDILYGRAGNDALDGGAGDDTLDGGPGADDLRGGAGQDAAAYLDRGDAVAVTLDDAADDGGAGEGDNVHTDVEDVYGGAGPDALSGNDGPNTIDGGGGADQITGGRGTDGLYGGAGDDTLDARDGAVDTVDCGDGNDAVQADGADVVTGCEQARALPRVLGSITHQERLTRTHAIFSRLRAEELEPAGAAVEILCTGGGCPFARRTFTGSGTINLVAPFRNRRLRVGTVLEVRIVAPGHLGRVVRYTVKRRALGRARLCLEPGAAAASACP